MNRILQILDNAPKTYRTDTRDGLTVGVAEGLILTNEAVQEIRELATKQHASTGRREKKYTKAGATKKRPRR